VLENLSNGRQKLEERNYFDLSKRILEKPEV
jgi:hypothetical protein